MRKLALTLALAALLCGCAKTSGTHAMQPPTATPTLARPAASAAPTGVPTLEVTAGALSYTAPAGRTPAHVQKVVPAPVLAHLVTMIGELGHPLANAPSCAVSTGETATLSFSRQGHHWVYTVPGVSCHQVTITSDGVAQPALTNSADLIDSIRAIAGLTGLKHPLTG